MMLTFVRTNKVFMAIYSLFCLLIYEYEKTVLSLESMCISFLVAAPEKFVMHGNAERTRCMQFYICSINGSDTQIKWIETNCLFIYMPVICVCIFDIECVSTEVQWSGAGTEIGLREKMKLPIHLPQTGVHFPSLKISRVPEISLPPFWWRIILDDNFSSGNIRKSELKIILHEQWDNESRVRLEKHTFQTAQLFIEKFAYKNTYIPWGNIITLLSSLACYYHQWAWEHIRVTEQAPQRWKEERTGRIGTFQTLLSFQLIYSYKYVLYILYTYLSDWWMLKRHHEKFNAFILSSNGLFHWR